MNKERTSPGSRADTVPLRRPEDVLGEMIRETFEWGGIEPDEKGIHLAAMRIIEVLNSAGYAIVPAALTPASE